ncbi:UvrD-helicase domain-containing protein [Pseudomonas sp. zjy_13]|uniref:UvrD-helicase domain-containing protein n=1 Tax=Pseudomonas sp. zjy_13 TaxID=3367263 RepID=UPI00370D007D
MIYGDEMISLSDEQRPIVHFDGRDKALVVFAYAGSGKTFTLIEFAKHRPLEKMIYIAYNRGIRDEAALRFPSNVKCYTNHQLAWQAFGRKYQHKLVEGNVRLMDVSNALGSKDWRLLSHAVGSVSAWLSSVDVALTESHVERTFSEKDLANVRPERIRKIKDTANLIWSKMEDPDDDLRMPHDGYLKLYQLTNPRVHKDIKWILYDEGQDANAVVTDIVLRQETRLVVVGDRHQQIYRFRGAENALDYFIEAGGVRFNLTKSYRFGPKVAAVANVILRAKGETVPVVGLGQDDHIFNDVPAKMMFGSPAIICRTVMGVLENAIAAAVEGRTIQFVGGKSSYNLRMLLDVYYLKVGELESISNRKFKSDFESFEIYESVAVETKDVEMSRALKILESYSDIPSILKSVEALIVGEKGDTDSYPDVRLMTAHKAKGLEFPDVIMHEDFPDLLDPELPPDVLDDELNLAYVTTTRAMKNLVLNDMVKSLIHAAYKKHKSQAK